MNLLVHNQVRLDVGKINQQVNYYIINTYIKTYQYYICIYYAFHIRIISQNISLNKINTLNATTCSSTSYDPGTPITQLEKLFLLYKHYYIIVKT